MINLVVALPAEARPLINHYQLQHKSTTGGFRIHQGDNTALIVSGPGKVAAAAATALLGNRLAPGALAGWVNIGIAGHASHDIGQGYLANRITDMAMGQAWYPPRVFDLPIESAGLLTVDTPENDYRQATVYDMEASGYYPVAVRFSTSELVQCYKVISDNRIQGTAAVTAQQCSRLIADRIAEIDQLVCTLSALQQQHRNWHARADGIDVLEKRWHFTVSQQHRLADLARRWHALLPNQPLWLDALTQLDNASSVLNCLQHHLDTMPAQFNSDPGNSRV